MAVSAFVEYTGAIQQNRPKSEFESSWKKVNFCMQIV